MLRCSPGVFKEVNNRRFSFPSFLILDVFSRCLRGPDTPGLPTTVGGALQLPARHEHDRGTSQCPCLPPTTSTPTTPPAAAHHWPQALTGNMSCPPFSLPSLLAAMHRGQSSACLVSNLYCRTLRFRSMQHRFSGTCCGRRRQSCRYSAASPPRVTLGWVVPCLSW